jgi:trans-AT polyketide synthase, acyltransferase and oxidoreductase domains
VTPLNSGNRQRQWQGDPNDLRTGASHIEEAIKQVTRPVYVVMHRGQNAVTHTCTAIEGTGRTDGNQTLPLLAEIPPLPLECLGDTSFKKKLGLRYAYIMGAMANGITSVEMLRAAGRAGMIAFFGAGGLTIQEIETAIDQVQRDPETYPYGFNLIHSPSDPAHEAATVDLYLRRGVNLVSASAYLTLTPHLVRYRVKGIHQTPDGRIVCPNHVIAKVSRVEVGRRFFAPPPRNILDQLLREGLIDAQEASLAHKIPVAQDMTAEADSGGHTDNRPALALLPIFLALRDEARDRFQFEMPMRVGLAGGIATPYAAAGAFAMGAAYVLTGSINQACIEADTAQAVKDMLVQAEQADVTMAPAADMFELGAKVQVLKRGTMFAMRGTKLYELYRTYDSYEQIPEQSRAAIERDTLGMTFAQAWQKTYDFFALRDPAQLIRAEQDSKHKMALVFRSYLGLSSRWAKSGEPGRRMDYQIWCGPAMGAFNAWVKGSRMEPAAQRRVAEVGLNLLYGASALTRHHWLSCQGIELPPPSFRPLPQKTLEKYLHA